MFQRDRLVRSCVSVAAAAAGLILIAANASAQPRVQVNTASDGTPGNGVARAAVLDDSGRHVVFADRSTNLVAGDGNGSTDVFVKDRVTNATTRVSVASDGTERTGPSGEYGVDVSGDGQIVVFTSMAPLLAGDTNTCGDPAGPCEDIYVHDRGTGLTTRVSVATGGTQANGASEWPGISRNGRFVTFTSHATNLVAGDTNAASDVFVHDRVAGTTTRVSVSTDGVEGGAGLHSLKPRINEDGSIVVFMSSALLADTPDPFSCLRDCRRVFVHDRTAGTTVRVPFVWETLVPWAQPPSPPAANVENVELDASGRSVALIVGVNESSYAVGLVYDRLTGRTGVVTRVDRTYGSGISHIALSGDGSVVQSNINNYSRGGTRMARLNRKAASTVFDPIFSGAVPEDFSFTGDVAVFGYSTSVDVVDYDADDDQMHDEWETAFGLDPEVADGAADPDGDGRTNLQEFQAGSHPRGTFSRYLAEGAANAFFTTQLAFVNVGTKETRLFLRFLGTNGLQSSTAFTIWPYERLTRPLTALSDLPGNDFSTVIESDQPVVVDRTMTWDGTTYGGHAETALDAPATTWFLAEGATHGAFSLFYLLQNPNDTDATATINYLRLAPQTPVVKEYTVPARSRLTIPVDSEGPELEATDVAARIDANLPIIVERAMYTSQPGQPPFVAGHGGAGVTATALKWFLAEGATGGFFDLYVLVANPNPDPADLKVTYLFPSGEPLIKNYTAGANNRLTISVDTEDPRLENTPVSIVVESINNQPIVVERAMWWPSPNWYEAHLSAGTTTTGTKWVLAEGEVQAADKETYILIANTGDTDGMATVTFLIEGQPAVRPQITVPLKANSRTNVRPFEIIGPARFGTIVESDGVPIVVERAIYQTVNGVTWSVGTSAVATKLQ